MKNQSVFSLIKGMLKLVKGKRYLIVLAVLVGTLGFLSSMGITFFAGLTLLKIVSSETVSLSYPLLITLLLVCGFLRGFLRYLEQYLNHYMAFTLLALVRNNIFSSLRKQGSKVLDDKSRGELLSILQSDTESLEVFYAHTITPFFIAIFTELIVLTLFIILVSYQASLLALLSYLIIGALTPVLFYLSNRKLGMAYRKELAKDENGYLNACYGIREILFFQKAEEEAEALQKNTLSINKLNQKLNDRTQLFSSIVSSLILVFDALMILFSFLLSQKGAFPGVKTILSYMMIATSFGPVISLSNLPSNLTMSFASAKRINAILMEKPKVKDGKESFDFECLEVNHVSFSYDGRNEVLCDVSFSLRKGEILGIEGKSGSGKSTLFKLLLHFEDPKSGSVLYNGKDVKNYSRESISHNITLFSQSTYLFRNTLRYNLLIAKPDASEAELKEALKKAGILDKVLSLDKGLDSEISDLGDNLSSGERQRLGLARIFLSSSPVILLDEATSNVDAYNESLILNQLKKAKSDKAIILISHRMTSLSAADRILHLKDGKLCS